MTKRAHLSPSPRRPRATRSEAGFTLTEMAIAIAIIIILAAIAIPVFLLQQQTAAKNAVITDVKATQTKIAQSLFNNPTADPIIGYYPENKNSTTIPSGGIGVLIIRTDGKNTIKVTNAVNDGTAATAATGSGTWRGYEITGTSSKVSGWYYTYNSNTGKYTVNTTNNKSTNPLPTKIPAFTTNTLPNAVKNASYTASVKVNAQPAATFTATGLPTGLGISSAGNITGTPTVDGVYTVYVTAKNSVGTTTRAYILTVQSVPVVTTTSLPPGTVGNPYTATVAASGYPAPSFAATGLPTGLAIDAVTGKISGTINPGVAGGTYTVHITANNTAGNGTADLAIAVAAAPTITTTSLPNAVKGTAYSTTIQTTGYPSPTFTLTGTSTGLSIDANTGVLSGTPTVSGQYNLTITVTNPGGTASKTLILTINSGASITTSSLNSTTVNGTYNQQITANGYPAATFSATGLPPGLTISSTGLITGSATTAGGYTVVITATNTYGGTTYTDSKSYTLPVYSGASITTTSLPNAYTNVAYNQTVQYSGYPSPMLSATTANWVQCATEGGTCTLPDGTPRQVRFGTGGTYTYGSATNSIACNTGTFGDPVNGMPKICYYLGNAAAGLPTGLNLNTSTGAITGTPPTNGGYTIVVTAANGFNTSQRTYLVDTLTKLNAVPSFTATKIFGNQATVNWNAVSGATNYTVTYGGGGSGSRTVISPFANNTQTITTDPNNITVSVVAKASGYYADAPATSGSFTMPGSRLTAGNQLTGGSACADASTSVAASCAITSADGNWTAVMQQDGNFVTYRNNLSNGTVQAFYATQTQGSGVRMSAQGDGNLVLYGANSGTKASDTYNNGNVRLDMQTDGNLVLRRTSDSAAIWGTFNVGGGNNSNFVYFVQSWNTSANDYDPSAENRATSTWHTYFGPASGFVTDDKYSGNTSFRITTSGNNPEGIIAGPDSMPVAAGQTVLVNMWVKGTPGEVWLVAGRQGNPYNEGMSQYTFTTNGTWQRVSVLYTAGSAFTGPYIQLRQNTISSGKYLYGDDVIIWRGWNQ